MTKTIIRLLAPALFLLIFSAFGNDTTKAHATESAADPGAIEKAKQLQAQATELMEQAVRLDEYHDPIIDEALVAFHTEPDSLGVLLDSYPQDTISRIKNQLQILEEVIGLSGQAIDKLKTIRELYGSTDIEAKVNIPEPDGTTYAMSLSDLEEGVSVLQPILDAFNQHLN